nr:MAG TPA: hypothetical protein [Caudoviricetes sp.]
MIRRSDIYLLRISNFATLKTETPSLKGISLNSTKYMKFALA